MFYCQRRVRANVYLSTHKDLIKDFFAIHGAGDNKKQSSTLFTSLFCVNLGTSSNTAWLNIPNQCVSKEGQEVLAHIATFAKLACFEAATDFFQAKVLQLTYPER